MAKLIILRGLPASGKSTWARSWCEDPRQHVAALRDFSR